MIKEIIKCTLPTDRRLAFTQPHIFLLAVINGCDTGGADATKQCVSFDKFKSTMQIVDLNAIGSVAGCMQCGTVVPKWVVIDRSPELAQTVFTNDI